MTQPVGDITRLVAEWSEGDAGALDQLMELVYDDLRAIAHRHLARGSHDAVLNTTVLVHEAFLKLSGAGEGEWPERSRFFGFCSAVMRRILIDYAREQHALKRGGTRIQVPLREDAAVVDAQILDLLAIDEALQRLEERSPRMARMVECRFFGGMSVPETAEALGTSVRTVEREWTRARAYLRRSMGG